MEISKENNFGTRQIATTAVLLAICIVSQVFKNLSVFITGPIVNTCIVLAVLMVNLPCGIILSIITPGGSRNNYFHNAWKYRACRDCGISFQKVIYGFRKQCVQDIQYGKGNLVFTCKRRIYGSYDIHVAASHIYSAEQPFEK